MSSPLERTLRYGKKQIEKLVFAIEAALDAHITPESCALLENAEIELNQLRATYADSVQQILLKCSDSEFEEKCDTLTEAQDALFESCRAAVARSRAEINKFKGKKARESLGNPAHSTELPSYEANTSIQQQFPKIKIPSFDGDYRQFMRFKGIFLNLVHEEAAIPNVRKLYYLQDSLQGEAARLIEDLPMADSSYEEAWSRIMARYDNQKALVMIYFRELLAIKKINHPCELRALLDTVTNAVNNLKLCNLPADNWSDLVAYMVYQCLDPKTKDDFDNSQSDSTKFFGWKVLHTFLKGRAYCSETRKLADSAEPKFTNPDKEPKFEKRKQPSHPSNPKATFVTVTREKCVACPENHLLIACQAFAAKTPKQRFELVSQNKLCTNCFSRSHPVKKCEGRGTCKLCGQRHHTLLHFPKRNSMGPQMQADPAPSNSNPVPALQQPTTTVSQQATMGETSSRLPTANLVEAEIKASSREKTVILPTAVAKIVLRSGNIITIRILIDSCSQLHFISENFVRKFRLVVDKKSEATAFTSATDGVVQVKSTCTLTLSSRLSNFQLPMVADVVPQSSLKYCIEQLALPKECQPIRGFPLADPAFANSPVHVPEPDMLIGAEYFERCMLNETRTFGDVTLRNSQFGWVVIGPVYQPATPFCGLAAVQPPCCLTVCQIEAQLRRFCDIEDVQSITETSLDEKERCERHFEETHKRGQDGKFSTQLPFALPKELLKDNFVMAQRNLWWSEKKRAPEVQPEYVQFMREYEQLHHMTPIAIENQLRSDYFIPHHPVVRPDSATTRTRVVFNASSKTASGYSLNDLLMVGPTIQPDLMDTLLRFREHKIAFTADIAKMYRCIWIHESDRSLQCILWREKEDEPVKAYQLNTLTYGTSCAPYIATKCLQKLAETVPDCPQAAFAIANHFYMDDLLTGAANLEEAMGIQKQIHETLASAGFVLRKYQSNSQHLLHTIDSSLLNVELKPRVVGDGEFANLLGVCWLAESDMFGLKVSKPSKVMEKVTRRSLLSETSKTFDPLGFASPFTIRAKVFMQRVWREAGSWDDPLPAGLASDFAAYWRELSELENFKISRLYSELEPPVLKQLIGFCDASELAYCAVVYLRCVDSCGKITVNFICAKTRVAPLKPVSIPRLELQAAWLLAQLISRISRVLKIDLKNVKTFCDSKVVLSWLAKSPSTWTIFVRNRVAKIVDILPFSCWAYVNTLINPADLATRGLSVKKFLATNSWTLGPTFLFSDFQPEVIIDDSIQLEKRKCKLICNISADHTPFINVINEFSSFVRLIRVFAFVFRFFRNCQKKARTLNLLTSFQPLSVEELHESQCRLIFVSQRYYFFDVFVRLLQGQEIKKKSPLRALHPFVDDNQLLRVGGRLRQASLPFDKKHPVVVPAKCKFTELLVVNVHTQFYHAQRSFIVTFLRAKYWFQGNLTSVVKKCLRCCSICTRYGASSTKQLMGDLPEVRVTVSRPFTKVGVDFAGPFTVKCVGHRSTIRFKAYIAVFVCLTTRALHLEVVSQLTTDHFLMSLSRFIARRGRPFLIWSDNGTNFVGAASYLSLNSTKIVDFSSEQGIRWRFNPPRAPHRGGIWESAVKSMKKHLLRSTHGQTFTFEELATVVTRVESILNSRPLLVRVDRNQETTVLTPGHFLIGDSLVSDPVPENENVRLAKRYEIVSRVVSATWRLWHRDYLAQLQGRSKWQAEVPNLQIGTIVIIKEPNVPPNEWRLGRVVAVFPDPMGLVRTVEVFHNGVTKFRDISSLVPLVTEESDSPAHLGESVGK